MVSKEVQIGILTTVIGGTFTVFGTGLQDEVSAKVKGNEGEIQTVNHRLTCAIVSQVHTKARIVTEHRREAVPFDAQA